MRLKIILTVLALNIFFAAPANALSLHIQGVDEGSSIPSKQTCEGANTSPEIAWKDVPTGTRSFALIADDPDAPAGVWVHWVIFNIPATSGGLKEGVAREAKFSDGSFQGVNDFKKIGYDGPCPPKGPAHRYFFKLYALDSMLNLSSGATKAALESTMKGHILAQAQVMGKFGR